MQFLHLELGCGFYVRGRFSSVPTSESIVAMAIPRCVKLFLNEGIVGPNPVSCVIFPTCCVVSTSANSGMQLAICI